MASENIIVLTGENFEGEVLSCDTPVLVDFWAAWCGPCRMIAPTVDAIADAYAGKVKVAKLDVDAHGEVAQRYGIASIPTLIIFKGGEIVDKLVGAAPKATLEEMLQKHIG